jgi:hypothetical protein
MVAFARGRLSTVLLARAVAVLALLSGGAAVGAEGDLSADAGGFSATVPAAALVSVPSTDEVVVGDAGRRRQLMSVTSTSDFETVGDFGDWSR